MLLSLSMEGSVAQLIVFCTIVGLSVGQPGSPLYEYVQRDDGMFSYYELDTYVQEGFTTYIINMTSQQWFDETWSNKPVWYHYIAIHIPDELNPEFYNHGFIYVATGSWDDNYPGPDSRHVFETGIYANRTGMVTAAIKQIPFQPIQFEGTLMERVEDTIIAWTWAKMLESNNTENPEILARFPMCKGVSKAMDAMQLLASEKTGGAVDLQNFMVAGESKRGWTTWLMPAADDRVVAIAPVVLSCLNLNANMHHYWQSFGNWTFLFFDYWIEGIPRWMDHPNIFPMLDLIDPYSYRDILTLPKLMVSGASDEFFMPDDYDYFFDDLQGEKYIWLLENTGHSISSSPLKEDLWTMLETFYISIIKNRPRPTLSWERFTDPVTGAGYIEVTTSEAPTSVVALSADTPEMVAPRRDFRTVMMGPDGDGIDTGVFWAEYPATDLGGNVWRVDFDKPDSGYRAFYLKVKFPYTEEGREFTFTTQASILSFDVDNYFPFEDCTLDDCQGYLV